MNKNDLELLVTQTVDSTNELNANIQEFTSTIDTKINTSILDQTTLSETTRLTEIEKMDSFRKNSLAATGKYYRRMAIKGSSHKFYPIILNVNGDDHQLSITRSYNEGIIPTPEEYLADSGETYNGIHWGSLEFTMNFNSYAGGGGGFTHILKHTNRYRNFIGAIRSTSVNQKQKTIIWLRGKTEYNLIATWNTSNLTVLCEDELPSKIDDGVQGFGQGTSDWWVQSMTESDVNKVMELYGANGIGSVDNSYGITVSPELAAWHREFTARRHGTLGRIVPGESISYNDNFNNNIIKLAKLFEFDMGSINPPWIKFVDHSSRDPSTVNSAADVTDYVYNPNTPYGTNFTRDLWVASFFFRIYSLFNFPELYDKHVDFVKKTIIRMDLKNPDYKYIANISPDNPTGKG